MSKTSPALSFERITVDCANDIRTVLLGNLDTGNEVVLDFDTTGTIDLAGIQLLLAFFRDAGQRGVPVQCTGTLCEQLVGRLKLFGFCGAACDSPENLCEALKSYFGER